MKKQILTLIIGILIGAIITTGVFLLIKGNSKTQWNRGNMGERPNIDTSITGESSGNRKQRNNNDSNNIEQTDTIEKQN